MRIEKIGGEAVAGISAEGLIFVELVYQGRTIAGVMLEKEDARQLGVDLISLANKAIVLAAKKEKGENHGRPD